MLNQPSEFMFAVANLGKRIGVNHLCDIIRGEFVSVLLKKLLDFSNKLYVVQRYSLVISIILLKFTCANQTSDTLLRYRISELSYSQFACQRDPQIIGDYVCQQDVRWQPFYHAPPPHLAKNVSVLEEATVISRSTLVCFLCYAHSSTRSKPRQEVLNMSNLLTLN